MRRFFCVLTILCLMLSLAGCTYRVPQPMTYPDYTFVSEPDATQLRTMAVKAMRDILSIQWSTEKEIRYRKNGPVNKKEFVHEPGKTYAGLLYSSASSGLVQFFEYYNTSTGCLEYPGTADELKLELGTSCADALLWSWSTVCTSIKGGFYPVMMVPSNGYRIVGDYTYRQNIFSYNEMPSYAIINNNGEAVILDAYTKTLPADALVSTTDNHAMMVIKEPTVIYTADGAIDTENSFITVQEQRAGGATFYEIKEGGKTYYYSGYLEESYSFKTLLEKNYIPVTAAEFLGEKPYEKASVTVSNPNCTTIDDFKNIKIESNYPLAVVKVFCKDLEGTETLVERTMFSGSSSHGVPKTYNLSEMKALDRYLANNDMTGCTLRLEVAVATAERFTPIEIKF